MADILKFGRTVRPGDVLRLGGAGFYRITRLAERQLYGVKVAHPSFPPTGEEVCICNDYMKDQYQEKDGKYIHIPIFHHDGIPVI